MNYLKYFKDIKPKYGYYVICGGDNLPYNGELRDFVINNIGRIISRGYSTYRVTFDNIPSNIAVHFHKDDDSKLFLVLDACNFLIVSDNKEDIELYIQSKKYNL